jgi:hypothetical protein
MSNIQAIAEMATRLLQPNRGNCRSEYFRTLCRRHHGSSLVRADRVDCTRFSKKRSDGSPTVPGEFDSMNHENVRLSLREM